MICTDEEFCLLLPKCELHAHLSGSLSASTMKKLLQYHRETWPEETLPDNSDVLIEETAKMKGMDFSIFGVIQAITDNPTAIRMGTRDVIREFAADGVKYLEIRSTPRAVAGRMSKIEYCESILREIEDAHQDAELGIIVKFMLSLDRRKIQEFDELLKLHNLLREKHSELIAGLDISGDPRVNDITILLPKLTELRKTGIKITVHLAEVLNEAETLEMLKYKPDRIGHGTFVHPETGGNQNLLNELIASCSPVEVCLTSNILCETRPSYDVHQARYLHDTGISVIICTDDKGIFSCKLSGEYQLAMTHFKWTRESLYENSLQSIQHCFASLETKNQLKHVWKEWRQNNHGLF